jgi:putative aldouronate transport system permease protein
LTLGVNFWPEEFTLDSYSYVFSNATIGRAYIVTIAKTILGTFGSVIFCLLAAYPLAKKNLPFRNVITIFFLITMFFSGGLIPTYLNIKKLHLINKFVVYILPGLVSTYSMIIVRNYIMSIDPGLEESAFIDGANYFNILFRIIIPVSTPVLATISLWAAVAHWNSWFDALIYFNGDKFVVLQLILRRMLMNAKSEITDIAYQQSVNEKDIITETVSAAITIVTIGPIIIVYPFLQKYFVKGIMVGSFKG